MKPRIEHVSAVVAFTGRGNQGGRSREYRKARFPSVALINNLRVSAYLITTAFNCQHLIPERAVSPRWASRA